MQVVSYFYYFYKKKPCRKWVDERLLDETIDFVQRLMEEECDQYFERIETVAIKVEII